MVAYKCFISHIYGYKLSISHNLLQIRNLASTSSMQSLVFCMKLASTMGSTTSSAHIEWTCGAYVDLLSSEVNSFDLTTLDVSAWCIMCGQRLGSWYLYKLVQLRWVTSTKEQSPYMLTADSLYYTPLNQFGVFVGIFEVIMSSNKYLKKRKEYFVFSPS